MILNEFIEIIRPFNGEKVLISISSIALVEKMPNNETRITLKERVNQYGNNLFVDTISNYSVIRDIVDKYQKIQSINK